MCEFQKFQFLPVFKIIFTPCDRIGLFAKFFQKCLSLNKIIILTPSRQKNLIFSKGHREKFDFFCFLPSPIIADWYVWILEIEVAFGICHSFYSMWDSKACSDNTPKECPVLSIFWTTCSKIQWALIVTDRSFSSFFPWWRVRKVLSKVSILVL